MTAALPEGLLASLLKVPRSAPFALLLRHADREPFQPGADGSDVGLLPIGEDRARALSSHDVFVNAPIAWADSSPIPRCLATAMHMGVAPVSNPLLGAPGAFVIDNVRASEAFLSLGTEAVVRAHLLGHAWPFMRSPEVGARLVLAHIASLLSSRGGTGLLVSHDSVVMPVISWATGERFEETWLEPLDGVVVLAPASGAVRVLWRGRGFEVRL